MERIVEMAKTYIENKMIINREKGTDEVILFRI